MPLLRRTIRHGSAALLLAAPLLGTAAPATAAEPGPTTFVTPRYELRLATDRLALTTVRAGRTVLATAPGAFRFRIGADWHVVREVTGSTRDGDTVRVTAATDPPGVTVDLRITLRSDRYDMTWSLSGTRADALSTAYALSSAGHWYGHGENSDQTVQPWPLDSRQLVDTGFSPASYQVVSPPSGTPPGPPGCGRTPTTRWTCGSTPAATNSASSPSPETGPPPPRCSSRTRPKRCTATTSRWSESPNAPTSPGRSAPAGRGVRLR
uniref:hypothetical protein n=1 Tax=Streptomyces sp. NBC_01562 TaxID=2975879 RepID=UPI002F90DDDF